MSSNLNCKQLVDGVLSQYVTVNDRALQIGRALTEVATIAVDDTNAATLSDEQMTRNCAVYVTEDVTPPDNNITLTVPDTARGAFYLFNDTDQQLIVTTSSQVGVAPRIPKRGYGIVLVDGTDAIRPGRYEQFYQFFTGMPASDQLMARFFTTQTVVFGTDFPGCKAHVETAPSDGDTVFVINLVQPSSTQKGTLTFPNGSNTGVFATTSGAFQLNPGGQVVVLAPTTPDSALSTVSIMLVGL